jgi:CheY-like chemotaxis protein
MKNVLIVDDEKPFLLSVSDGFNLYAADFNLFTAENGKQAIDLLAATKIDIVVTDLKMPEMDGFDLLAYMSRNYPTIPIIVMTAFGTPEIETRLNAFSIAQYIEKPLDFNMLTEKIFDILAASSSGHIKGISLPSFLQLVESDKKTCTLRITSRGREGYICFVKGKPMDAKAGELEGKEAAYEIICWEDAEIEIKSGCRQRKDTICSTLTHLLMEGFRLTDEKNRDTMERREEDISFGEEEYSSESKLNESIAVNEKEAYIMSVQDKLKELTSIDGFGGVGVFTPTGETLGILEGDKGNLKEIGILANNVLMNAQKASLDMGTGRGQLVHVETESGAQIIVRCMNEGSDPLKSQPGKAHIHLVLVLKDDSSIGLAKMKVASVIGKLAEDFRM